MVERKTRFTLLVQLDGKHMETVTAGLTKVLKRSPANLLKSLTWDRGMELAGHKKVTANPGIVVFLTDPRSLGNEEQMRTQTASWSGPRKGPA